jgi:hypothetical protein
MLSSLLRLIIESPHSLRYDANFKARAFIDGGGEFRCCRKKLLVFGNSRSGKPWSTTGLSAILWDKRHRVSLPIILLALCRSILPHRIVFAFQVMILRRRPKLLALDAKGYLSYCGPFSIVSENEVIHHLKLCSFENWVGTDQHRYAQLDLNKDTLTLSTPPMLTQGRKGSNRLTWKRIVSNARAASPK